MERDSPSFFRPIQQGLILIFLTLLVFAGFAALFAFRGIFLSVLIGIGAGALIAPAIGWLHRSLRIPRGLGGILFFILITGLFGAIGYWVLRVISEQGVPLLLKLPELFERQQRQGGVLEGLEGYPRIREALRDQLGALNLGATFKNAAGSALRGARVGLEGIGIFLFIVTVGVYIAISPDAYLRGFLSLFPRSRRRRMLIHLSSAGRALRRWFVSQLIAMTVVGLATAAGLRWIGLDYWLLIGLLTAILDFIPYVGPFFALLSGMVVTLATEPNKAWLLLVIFIGVQQFESNVVIPLVMKGRIQLPPVHLMTLVWILGSAFGLLGVFVAPPILAVAHVLYKRIYVPRMERPRLSESGKRAA